MKKKLRLKRAKKAREKVHQRLLLKRQKKIEVLLLKEKLNQQNLGPKAKGAKKSEGHKSQRNRDFVTIFVL